MHRVSDKIRSKGRLDSFIIAVTVSLMVLSLSSSSAESLSEDKYEAMLLSPPGWAAMIFQPLGMGMESTLRAMFLTYEGYNPLPRLGEAIESTVREPTLKKVRVEKREKYLLPGLATRGSGTDFFSEDLDRSVNLPAAK